MSSTLKCPKCRTDAVAGWKIQGVYDGVLFWQCEKGCGRFHRWAQGTRLWREAEKYVGKDRAKP